MSRLVQHAHSYAKDDQNDPKPQHDPVFETHKDQENFIRLLQQAIHEPDRNKKVQVPRHASDPTLWQALKKLIITSRYPPLEEPGSQVAESFQNWWMTAPVGEMSLESLPGCDTRTLVGYANSLAAEKSRGLLVHNCPPTTPGQSRPSAIEENPRNPAPKLGERIRFPAPARSFPPVPQRMPSKNPPIFFSTASQHLYGYLAPESITPCYDLSKEIIFPSFNDVYYYRTALHFNDYGFRPTVYNLQGERFRGSQAEKRPWYKQATSEPHLSVIRNTAFMKFWCSTSAYREGDVLNRLLSTGDSDLIYAIEDNDVLGIGRSVEDAIRDYRFSPSTYHWGLNILGKALMAAKEKANFWLYLRVPIGSWIGPDDEDVRYSIRKSCTIWGPEGRVTIQCPSNCHFHDYQGRERVRKLVRKIRDAEYSPNRTFFQVVLQIKEDMFGPSMERIGPTTAVGWQLHQ
ncbi:hypothetical protein IFR05_016300 [Cadophora sp. M221]|nr:hypothetical protein IFR05_016300 [Cadophora sp. M221]